MEEEQVSPSQNADDHKRAWEPPVIEELDFSATEAAYVPGLPFDLGIYTI
jgi:hypothetical protein